MIYLLITNLLREMSQSGMCFYLFLQWMSSDFRNLRDALGALHQQLGQCALSAAEILAAVSIGRFIISAFCIIRMPPINFYVIL